MHAYSQDSLVAFLLKNSSWLYEKTVSVLTVPIVRSCLNYYNMLSFQLDPPTATPSLRG